MPDLLIDAMPNPMSDLMIQSASAACLALALALGVLPPQAAAASKRAERAAELERSLELTMIVYGDIDVDADGRVLRHSLDHRDKLSPDLVRMLDARIPAWSFAPQALAEGQTHSALRMRLRVFAHRIGEQRDVYRMSVRDAAFLPRDDARPDTDRLRYDSRSRLSAHDTALRGIVYMALRIGPDGKAMEAFVERVDLVMEGSAKDMEKWRTNLSRLTERQARILRFIVPTTGPDAGLQEWSGRLPVAYNTLAVEDWEWQAYYRGPETRAPWKPAEESDNAVPTDLVPAGNAETPEQARRLLTPLDVQ